MADEITISASLEYLKDGESDELKRLGRKFDMSGTESGNFVQSIGTTEEAITIPPDIGTVGYVLAINLDEDNAVNLRSSTGGTNAILLEANGGLALFKKSTAATLYGIATTAACRVRFLILEA